MADNLSRFEIVRTRCTKFARELLAELEGNVIFPAVLDRLIEIDGMIITRSDIERVLLGLRKPDGKRPFR